MFVIECQCPPKFTCWDLTPNMVAFGGEALRMLVSLHKRPQRDLHPFCHVRTNKTADHEPGSSPSPDTQPTGTSILDSSLWNVRNPYLLVTRPQAAVFCYSSWNGPTMCVRVCAEVILCTWASVCMGVCTSMCEYKCVVCACFVCARACVHT